MKSSQNKSYKYYYLSGIIVGAIAVIGLAVFISLPMANQELSMTFRRVCVGIDGVFLVLLMVASYLFKKGTYFKNEMKREEFLIETEQQLKEILDKKYNNKKDLNEQNQEK